MSSHVEWCHQTGRLPREDEESYSLFDLWTVSDYPNGGRVTLNNDALTSHPRGVYTTGHQMCRAGASSFPMGPWAACVQILLSGCNLAQERPHLKAALCPPPCTERSRVWRFVINTRGCGPSACSLAWMFGMGFSSAAAQIEILLSKNEILRAFSEKGIFMFRYNYETLGCKPWKDLEDHWLLWIFTFSDFLWKLANYKMNPTEAKLTI